MQAIIFATLLVAGITAFPSGNHLNILPRQLNAPKVPQDAQPFIIEQIIRQAIINALAAVPDPFESTGPQVISYSSPDGALSFNCVVDPLKVEGASNIVINNVALSLFPTSRISVDATFPQITVTGTGVCTIVADGEETIIDGQGQFVLRNVHLVVNSVINLSTLQLTNPEVYVDIETITSETAITITRGDTVTTVSGDVDEELLEFFRQYSDLINAYVAQLLDGLSV